MSGAAPPPDGDEETVDRLAGDWRIVQLRRGHRFSADDLLTAWTAARARPAARRLLDLGAGIGSVGLLALWRLGPAARLTMVEAQAVSAALARRSVALNDLGARVTVHEGDLRDWRDRTRHDLVTGSPPYIPPARGVASPHPQRAAARLELRGDVFDYCRAGAGALDEDGAFVFCHAASDPRPERAAVRAGLVVTARRDVHFRHRLGPTIALFTCAFRGPRDDPPPLVIRDAGGHWTDEYLALREEMGAPVEFLERARSRTRERGQTP